MAEKNKIRHHQLPTGIRLNIDKYLFNGLSASQQQQWISSQTPQKVETIQGRKPKRKRLSLQERMKRAKEANKASGGSVKGRPAKRSAENS